EALREDARARDSALAPDEVARRGSRIDAGEAQRDVRLDRRVEIAGALEPDRPGAVRALAREQLVRDLAIELRRAQADDVVPDQVLRDHRRVGLQLALPPPVGVLELEQAGRAALEGAVDCCALGRDRHAAAASAVIPDNTCAAAARPLRTA